jgi:hypothetical protein
MRAAAILLALALPTLAFADGGVPLQVEVGKTITVDVGYLRGLLCDDLSIVSADLRNKSATSNELVLTGLKPGTTECRVGSIGQPTFRLFDIRVIDSRHR